LTQIGIFGLKIRCFEISSTRKLVDRILVDLMSVPNIVNPNIRWPTLKSRKFAGHYDLTQKSEFDKFLGSTNICLMYLVGRQTFGRRVFGSTNFRCTENIPSGNPGFGGRRPFRFQTVAFIFIAAISRAPVVRLSFR
jgi:hypothetical protein